VAEADDLLTTWFHANELVHQNHPYPGQSNRAIVVAHEPPHVPRGSTIGLIYVQLRKFLENNIEEGFYATYPSTFKDRACRILPMTRYKTLSTQKNSTLFVECGPKVDYVHIPCFASDLRREQNQVLIVIGNYRDDCHRHKFQEKACNRPIRCFLNAESAFP
jgi:hypothetical protein